MARKLNRRRLVAALGASGVASVSGCIGSSALATNSTDEASTGEPTDGRPTGDGPVQQIEAGAAPDESPFKHDFAFLTQPTDDHPARLRVGLTNAAGTAHTVQTVSSPLPFPTSVGKAADSDEILVLASEDDPEHRGGCWRAYPKSLPAFATETVSPGETLSATYALVNPVDGDSCWPTGRYRFSQGYTVDPAINGIEYSWAFIVHV